MGCAQSQDQWCTSSNVNQRPPENFKMLRRNHQPGSSSGQPTSNMNNAGGNGNGLRKIDSVDEMYTNNIMDQDNNKQNNNKMNRKNQD